MGIITGRSKNRTFFSINKSIKQSKMRMTLSISRRYAAIEAQTRKILLRWSMRRQMTIADSFQTTRFGVI